MLQLPTGYPYLLARTNVGDPKAAGLLEARKFLEERVAAWDTGGKGKGYLKGLNLPTFLQSLPVSDSGGGWV